MELIEPLWFTITSVHDLIRANKDACGELEDLADTIKLIEAAIMPLRGSSLVQHFDSLRDLLMTLKQCLTNAKEALEKISAASSNDRLASLKKLLFRPKELDELKGYQEKLKTLTPILSLAITSASTSQPQKTLETTSTAADRVITNAAAKKFWKHHFGDKFKISWDWFQAAFEHDYGQQDKSIMARLRAVLDRNQDGEVDIYELEKWTGAVDPLESLRHLAATQSLECDGGTIRVGQKRKAEDQEDTATPDGDGDDYGNHSDERRKKRRVDHNVGEVASSNPTLASATPTGFVLSVCGTHSAICTTGAAYSELRHTFQGSAEGSRTLGRGQFVPQLPSELLVRVSRQHCTLQWAHSATVAVVNHSDNGTYVNGTLLPKGGRAVLKDGDVIGLVMAKPAMRDVELGYVFRLLFE